MARYLVHGSDVSNVLSLGAVCENVVDPVPVEPWRPSHIGLGGSSDDVVIVQEQLVQHRGIKCAYIFMYQHWGLTASVQVRPCQHHLPMGTILACAAASG